MLLDKCAVREMSTLSMRAPLQTTMLEARAIRVRGMTSLDGVRRNLFGCTDREENRRFVEKELARQLEIDSQKWGFDFANERPMIGTTARFSWQLVSANSVPPALRRPPMSVPAPTPVEDVKMSSPESGKTQKRITDFLKPRKRLASSVKKSPGGHKHDCGHLQPKVARLVQSHFKRPS